MLEEDYCWALIRTQQNTNNVQTLPFTFELLNILNKLFLKKKKCVIVFQKPDLIEKTRL